MKSLETGFRYESKSLALTVKAIRDGKNTFMKELRKADVSQTYSEKKKTAFAKTSRNLCEATSENWKPQNTKKCWFSGDGDSSDKTERLASRENIYKYIFFYIYKYIYIKYVAAPTESNDHC